MHALDSGGMEIVEHRPQGVAPVQLIVAVGQDDQCRCAADPPAEMFEQIERRCIGPVNLLKHEHGRLLATLQLVQESTEDRGPVGCGSHQLQQSALCLKRDVVQRAQRLRREQRVAAATWATAAREAVATGQRSGRRRLCSLDPELEALARAQLIWENRPVPRCVRTRPCRSTSAT